MEKPRNLSWIDLSFNQLEEVPQVLASYQSLNVVYLHSNRIKKLSSAKALTELPALRSLTLHGNALEQVLTPSYPPPPSAGFGFGSLEQVAVSL